MIAAARSSQVVALVRRREIYESLAKEELDAIAFLLGEDN